jgi:hypothetical protein
MFGLKMKILKQGSQIQKVLVPGADERLFLVF